MTLSGTDPRARTVPGVVAAPCASASTARCGSTTAPGRRTPPTPRTSGRCRSASSCPAPSRPRSRRSRSAASTTCRSSTAVAGPAWPDSAPTRPSCSTSPSTATASSRSTRRAGACVVEPGIVLDVLNRQLAPTGLRFGPEPATHQNCTLGGMIGNNSCGATAQRTGKVVDNIVSLDVLLYDGTRFTARRTDDEEYAETSSGTGDRRSQIYRTLRRLRDEHGDLIRERYPDIPRRVSGYNLDSLLPEHGFDLAGFLVGQRVHAGDGPARRARAGPGRQGAHAGRARVRRHRRGRRRRARTSSSTTRSRSRASTTT